MAATEDLMSELATTDRVPKRAKARSRVVDDIVTANGLATHLGMSRQNVGRLTAEAVLEQRSDGRYEQTASRLRYIKHLRAEHRRSPRSEADAAHASAKAEMLQLRIAKEKRELMHVAEHNEFVDKCIGMILTRIGGLPALIGGADLAVRRKVEGVIFQLRVEIADECQRQADDCKPG
jgi:hypothetical protein